MPRPKKDFNKTKRRAHNEGSVYFRKDVGLWYGKVVVGRKADGSPKHEYVKGEKQADVLARVNALAGNVFENGLSVESSRSNTNFNDLLKRWYELSEAPDYTAPTDEKFRSMMKHHIFPAFKNLDIKNVDYQRLRVFFGAMKTTKQIAPKIGYCPNTKPKYGYSDDFIGKMKNLLYRFFDYAVGHKFVKYNPVEQIKKEERFRKGKKKTSKRTSAANVTVTGIQKKKVFALPPLLRASMLEWVSSHPFLKPIFITEMYMGLRPQEIITLVWDDIDFETGFLTVERAMKRTIEHDADWNVISRGVEIGEPKSEAGFREIPLEDVVITSLQEWKQHCVEKGIRSQFVFPNTKTGEMRTYSSLRSLFRRFITKHDLADITLYTLRHTCATILLEQGVNPEYAKIAMGHEKVETLLNIYSHGDSNKDAYKKSLNGALTAEHVALTKEKSAKPCTV